MIIFKKSNGNPYPDAIDLTSTSTPITVHAVDDSGAPIFCTWYLAAVDRGSASHPASLNTPEVAGQLPCGIDPSDPDKVQAQCVAVTGTNCQVFPANQVNRNLSAKSKLVATSGSQTREMLINITN